MTNESQQQIAREAAEKSATRLLSEEQWHDQSIAGVADELEPFILAAIERATEATAEHFRQGLYGKLDEAIELVKAAQPQRSEPVICEGNETTGFEIPQSCLPQRSEQQEWTPEILEGMHRAARYDQEFYDDLITAHNAALEAERQRTEHWAKVAEMFRVQLLSAQAAIEKRDEALLLCTGISSIPLDHGFNVGPEFDTARKKAVEARSININLSALHQHDAELLDRKRDRLANSEWHKGWAAAIEAGESNKERLIAEVREPLVEALQAVREQARSLIHSTPGITNLIHYCDAALALERSITTRSLRK